MICTKIWRKNFVGLHTENYTNPKFEGS